jgi:hypothetical protein
LQIIPALIILPPEEVFMMKTLILLALIKENTLRSKMGF